MRALLLFPSILHGVQFWGPLANWGFVLAGVADTWKPPEQISTNMTAAMCVYSLLFMRFAWEVQPRNYLLLACHACNETVQASNLYRNLQWKYSEEGRNHLSRDLAEIKSKQDVHADTEVKKSN